MLSRTAENLLWMARDMERAENTARMLDVKYHVLLPETEQVGGYIDYYQWGALLRSVGAFRAAASITTCDTSLSDAAKCALISFDSTVRSNVSVGPPIDLLIYRRNSLKKDFATRLEDDHPYLQAIREGWGGAIHKAFHAISHHPGWTF